MRTTNMSEYRLRCFVVGSFFAFVGFCLLLAKGIEFLEYIFSQYGTYIFIAFFLIPCLVHSIWRISSPFSHYFVKEAPFFLPLGFLALLLLPLLDKNGYPALSSMGGLVYFTFLSIPAMLLTSDLVAWAITKVSGRPKSPKQKGA
ncbi:MAG: hypothetical protein SWO11_19245 [Thermodesulfobacteriota bacterium]|nr:hypothetical protein [Thermodesulfobacteriota bacterium]